MLHLRRNESKFSCSPDGIKRDYQYSVNCTPVELIVSTNIGIGIVVIAIIVAVNVDTVVAINNSGDTIAWKLVCGVDTVAVDVSVTKLTSTSNTSVVLGKYDWRNTLLLLLSLALLSSSSLLTVTLLTIAVNDFDVQNSGINARNFKQGENDFAKKIKIGVVGRGNMWK
jgi:predicted transglutaminase-like protease